MQSEQHDGRRQPTGAPDAGRAARLDRLAMAVEAWSGFAGHGDAAAVSAFLAAHDDLRDLLEPMLADDADADDGAETPSSNDAPIQIGSGHLIGDHRIVREVGRGGMGTVFEAEQISLGRRVALKLLHDHLAWSPKSIERFRREAAAAARLSHPGIAPIHEVGEWRGRHYFTMEFVDGVPLHEAMLRPRLGVRADVSRAAEAAELVARVADALQHAHEHGFVHRDVKPHNIMVSADGSVRLLDFGLVKHEGTQLDTLTHEFLGTPHYCSPEQVVGAKTGPASDVFSLGIVLYELLAGRRPFAGETAREILERIELGVCEPLSRAASGAPRDLVTICQKAMEPVAAQRYASAGDLAADLRRFLRIEPILAMPPGIVARATKWFRRHRLRVGLWTLTLLLVVGTPTALAVREGSARAAVELANVELATAERAAFDGVEQTLAMLAENLEQYPDPVGYQGPRIAAVVRQCEKFLALRTVDDDRRMRAARAFHAIATIQARLEMVSEAAVTNRRAAAVLDDVGAETDEHAVAALRGKLLRQELRLQQMRNPDASEESFRAAIAQWRSMVERPDASLPDIVEFAETLVMRARALADLPRRRLEAEGLVRHALTLLTPERRAVAVAANTLALRASNTLGHLQVWTGRNELAAKTLADVVAQIDAEPASAVLGLERTLALAALGEARQGLGDAEDAQRLLAQAIESGRVQVLAYPGSAPLRRALHASRVRLATLLLLLRRLDDAERILREADMALASAVNESWMDRTMRADLDVQLANCILLRTNGRGDCEDARELLRGACTLLGDLVREHPENVDYRTNLGGAWNNLAALDNQQGRHDEAEKCATTAIAHQQAALAAFPESGKARMFLGMHYGQLAFALAHLADAAAAVQAVEMAMIHAPRHTMTLRLAAEAATMVADRAADAGEKAATARVAVAALEKMAAVNPQEAGRWCEDARFRSLRGRPDFEALRHPRGEK